MWELLITPKADAPTIKAEFSVSYKLDETSDNKIYQYFFDINDYQVNIYVLVLYSMSINVYLSDRLSIYWMRTWNRRRAASFVEWAPCVNST